MVVEPALFRLLSFSQASAFTIESKVDESVKNYIFTFPQFDTSI